MIVRRTPCIGICSTTYGDLVCRGCKRHAHEIVGWNRMDDAQKQSIWSRLRALRDGAVEQVLEAPAEGELETLRELAARCGVHLAEEETALGYLYYLLRAGEAGPARVRAEFRSQLQRNTAAAILTLVDAEFERRAVAQYDYAYRRGGAQP